MRTPAVLLAVLLAAPAGAAGPQMFADARERIDAALAAVDAAAAPEAQVAALTGAISGYEAALAELRGTVFGAEDRERALTLDLQARRDEISRLLAALQALSRTPAPAQALHPGGLLGAARASVLLAALTPELQREAQALAAELAEIDAARRARALGLEDLAGGLEVLEQGRTALLAAADRRAPVDGGVDEAVHEVLARDAETLSDLADRFAGLGGDGGDAARLSLDWPVAGRVLRGFGEADAAGVRRPGLVVEAAPLAVVTAPADARVRYAGPFLDYGYVVVLEPRADVLVVLAGLATLEAASGSVVAEGALLGLLGGRSLDAQEYLMLGQTGTGETPGETLYIEVRHGQGPVDPEPWFTDPNG